MDLDQALNWPEMALVRQSLMDRSLPDLQTALGDALAPLADRCVKAHGKSVAVAVGSRNIDQLDKVVWQVLRFLEKKGFKPFIVPAMGSHGGATAVGQEALLAGFNVTETSMQVPVVSDMETRRVGRVDEGPRLYIAGSALDADHIVLINRVKPHTKFSAAVESGLCKMLTIGLGKIDGAAEFHRSAVTRTFAVIEEAASALLKEVNILFGQGLVEDGRGQLSRVRALVPESLIEAEKEMLSEARSLMGTIPFDDLDILVVDRMGKDISGIGMDSNVTGRHRDIVGDFYAAPHVKRIFVRDLSRASQGNANGIGLADVTTRRLVEQMDPEKTFVNCLAAISPEKAAVPMHFETDRQCLAACAATTGRAETESLRIVRIRDTASLGYLQVSRPLETELRGKSHLRQLSDWQPLAFDGTGNLQPFYPKD